MSRSTSRKNQQGRRPSMSTNSHSNTNTNNSHEQQQHLMYSHGHGSGHVRTRSRQLQAEAQQQQFPATSDYESDTVQYMASHPAMPPATLAARTNTELNLSVLKRYLPSITSILSIAANAVVYTFQPPSEWKRSNMEGTMFVCSQHKSPAELGDAGCLFILNRKGLQNFILDLNTVTDFELAGDLLIFKLDYAANQVQLESGDAVVPNVLGLWTYAEDKSDRETNAALIHDMWFQARTARAQGATSDPATITGMAETGPAMKAVGRKVSLTELFSTYGGNILPPPGP